MAKKRQGPKILTLDIETAPLEVHAWGLWKVNVGLNQIITDWTMLSYCGKWLDKKSIIYADNRHQEDMRDDRHLLGGLWKLLDEADIIIAQNGIRFDLPKIRARLIQEGYPPFSPVKVVDTMVEAKKLFRFTSNRLAWLSTVLTDTPKDEHKQFPGFELWLECLAGNVKAWNEMKKYNPTDVISTEKVYLKLRPWIVGHPNVAQYYDDELRRCPKCGNTHQELQDEPALTQTGEYELYRCGGCGGFSRGRYTRNSKAKRLNLLSN